MSMLKCVRETYILPIGVGLVAKMMLSNGSYIDARGAFQWAQGLIAIGKRR